MWAWFPNEWSDHCEENKRKFKRLKLGHGLVFGITNVVVVVVVRLENEKESCE
jgi:hypothetical protein